MSNPDDIKPEFQQDDNIGKPLIRANLGSLRNQMDACFLPMGFTSESGLGTLKYVGEVNGRLVTFTFAVRTRNKYVTGNISYRRYQGVVMDITINTSVQTRLAILPKPRMLASAADFIHKLQNKKPVSGLSEAYAPFRVWADDPDWTLSYLERQDVQDAFRSILLAPEQTKTGGFMIGPGILRSTMSVVPDGITQEAAQRWLDQLVELTAVIEKNPPPTEVTPTWLERQKPQTAAFIIAIGLLFGIPALLFACCMLPVLILIVMNGL